MTPSLPAEPNPMHSCRQGSEPQAYHIIQACLGFHSCKIELRSLLRAQRGDPVTLTQAELQVSLYSCILLPRAPTCRLAPLWTVGECSHCLVGGSGAEV